jgi:multidrug transporter EmrE-like cation transporter
MKEQLTNSPLHQLLSYLEIKYKLVKYKSIDNVSQLLAEVITDVLLTMLLLVTFIFFTIALALFAAQLFHSIWEGIGCVTVLYCLIALSGPFFKARLQDVFVRILIKKLFRKRNAKKIVD